MMPDILTSNTYFWTPSGHASGRRANEKRQLEDVRKFITENKEALDAARITIEFSYSETCTRVYKRCKITKDGRRSNITAVKKALNPPVPKPEEIKLPSSQAAYRACAAVIREHRKVRKVKNLTHAPIDLALG